MSAVLKIFPDFMIKDRPTWWVILECGHWYHWTGDAKPEEDKDFPCPSCKSTIIAESLGSHMLGRD